MSIKFSGLTTLIGVFDMATSIAFYRDIIGFEIVMQSRSGEEFGWALLQRNSVQIMLNTNYEAEDRPPARDRVRDAAHSDTTFYFDCPDLDAAYEYLHSKGVPVSQPVIRDYGMRQLSLTDPDGYGLCFQHPVKSS